MNNKKLQPLVKWRLTMIVNDVLVVCIFYFKQVKIARMKWEGICESKEMISLWPVYMDARLLFMPADLISVQYHPYH